MAEHAVPTVTQCEKCDLRRGRHVKEQPYTNYARFLTTYRVDQPIQLRLHEQRHRQRQDGGGHG